MAEDAGSLKFTRMSIDSSNAEAQAICEHNNQRLLSAEGNSQTLLEATEMITVTIRDAEDAQAGKDRPVLSRNEESGNMRGKKKKATSRTPASPQSQKAQVDEGNANEKSSFERIPTSDGEKVMTSQSHQQNLRWPRQDIQGKRKVELETQVEGKVRGILFRSP